MRKLPVLLLLTACAGADDSRPVVTYHADVRPILERHCVSCHGEGGIGPFELTHFDGVAPIAALVADATETRRMPPWPTSSDCNDYEDDLSLTEDEIGTLVDWVEAGAPEGDRKDYVAPEMVQVPALPRVDHRLEMPVPYTPTGAEDDYRCFLLDWPVDAMVSFVTGFGVTPGNDELVHHVIGYVVPPQRVEEFEALDAADEGPGYACFGGPGGTTDSDVTSDDAVRWLGAWAPGGVPGTFPSGTGIPVEGGSKIVVQVHYHIADNPISDTDQSTLDLMVAAAIDFDKWALILPFTNIDWVVDQTMDIPAGAMGHTHTLSMVMEEPFLAYSAGFHMHTRGRSGFLRLDRADGSSQCMVDIADWDFNWQRSYRFTEPLLVDVGDTLNLSCTWDNSTDQDLNWGDGTQDEMCLSTLYVTEP